MSLCLSLFIHGQSLDQFLVASSGGSYSIPSNAQLSWSLGEPLTHLYPSDQRLSEGFHQGILKKPSGNKVSSHDGFTIYAAPNPATHVVFVELQNECSQVKELKWQILDQNLRPVKPSELFTGPRHSFFVEYLPQGVYYVHLVRKGETIGITPFEKI